MAPNFHKMEENTLDNSVVMQEIKWETSISFKKKMV